MYPQRANFPLQGLERCALTVGAVSGPQCQLELSIGAISSVVNLYGWQKALWKSKPVNLSQYKAVKMHSYLM